MADRQAAAGKLTINGIIIIIATLLKCHQLGDVFVELFGVIQIHCRYSGKAEFATGQHNFESTILC